MLSADTYRPDHSNCFRPASAVGRNVDCRMLMALSKRLLTSMRRTSASTKIVVSPLGRVNGLADSCVRHSITAT